MKVELEKTPSTDNDRKAHFRIVLYPETNEEMADLSWGLDVTDGPEKVVIRNAGRYGVAIIFKGKP